MADAPPPMARLPWYPRDFASSTRGWTINERGIYRELLDCQWDMAGLPGNPDEMRLMIGATPDEWLAGWPRCECKFPIDSDGHRRNPRLERHRAHSLSLYGRTRKRAQGAAEARWGRDA